MGIYKLLQDTVNLLAGLVGVVAVISILIAGFQYMTARDNAQQVSDAKQRIVVSVISLILFGFVYVLLQWLIPGEGIFS